MKRKPPPLKINISEKMFLDQSREKTPYPNHKNIEVKLKVGKKIKSKHLSINTKKV